MRRRSKIIATLGPSSCKLATIEELIRSGMNVARLNFSHGDHDSHRALFEMVRDASQRLGIPVAVMQDLQGPRVRLGLFKDGGATLERGQRFALHTRPVTGDVEHGCTNYESLANDVEPGEAILVADGRVRLRVVEVDQGVVHTEVEVPGPVHDRAGLNLPQTGLRAPALTPKDIEDVQWGLDMGVDYVALSFVRAALDIHQLRTKLGKHLNAPRIIAKIERPRAVTVAHQLISAADGVMVARGDLGVELPPEQVPMVQKDIIRRANQGAKIAITATQMLESMRSSPTPTRAEASDVANAILDGTDAVMLSGETANGEYPIESVRMMARIIIEVETSRVYRARPDQSPDLPTFSSAVATAATAAADKLGAAAICAFTATGRTARLLTTQRPSQPIIALTPNPRLFHRMAMFWGITPFEVPEFTDTTELVRGMESILRERLVVEGDAVVMVMGVPIGTGAEPNAIKLHRLGESGPTASWEPLPETVVREENA